MTPRERAIDCAVARIKMGHDAYHRRLDLMMKRDQDPTNLAHKLVCGMWGAFGMQSVRMPDPYVAALIATDVHPDIYSQVKLPWLCFEVLFGSVIPGFESVIFCQRPDGTISYLVNAASGSIVAVGQSISLETFVTGLDSAHPDPIDGVSPDTDLDQVSRVKNMAARLIVNACLDIGANHSSRIAKSSLKLALRKFQRVPREFVIGKPLKIDCVQNVRDYASGKTRGLSSVTTLVRGHWRDQPYGPHKSLRKIIWIMPHFRGDGPLLVRPVQLGDQNAQVQQTQHDPGRQEGEG